MPLAHLILILATVTRAAARLLQDLSDNFLLSGMTLVLEDVSSLSQVVVGCRSIC